MLIVAIAIMWLAAAALFWTAFTGLELRFEILRRKNARVAGNAVPINPRAKAS